MVCYRCLVGVLSVQRVMLYHPVVYLLLVNVYEHDVVVLGQFQPLSVVVVLGQFQPLSAVDVCLKKWILKLEDFEEYFGMC